MLNVSFVGPSLVIVSERGLGYYNMVVPSWHIAMKINIWFEDLVSKT